MRRMFSVSVSSELNGEQRQALESANCKIGRLTTHRVGDGDYRAHTGVCLRARSEDQAIKKVAEALGVHPLENDYAAHAIPIMARITVPRTLTVDEQRALKDADGRVWPKDRSEAQWVIEWTDADQKGNSTGVRERITKALGIEHLDPALLDFREPCDGMDD